MNILDFDTTSQQQQKILELTKLEEKFYHNLFESLDINNTSAICPKEAAKFFMKSGLKKLVLKEIWALSSSNNEFLSQNEFNMVLKLISLEQDRKEVSIESAYKNSSNLPIFTDINDNNDLYFLSPNNIKNYGEIFNSNQTGGIINGKTAKNLVSSFQLTVDILSLNWKLVDVNNEGFLKKNQFICFLHLINLAKKGVPPLKHLNISLRNFVFGIGQEIEIASSQNFNLPVINDIEQQKINNFSTSKCFKI